MPPEGAKAAVLGINRVRWTRETVRRMKNAKDSLSVARITAGSQEGSGTIRMTAVKISMLPPKRQGERDC